MKKTPIGHFILHVIMEFYYYVLLGQEHKFEFYFIDIHAQIQPIKVNQAGNDFPSVCGEIFAYF